MLFFDLLLFLRIKNQGLLLFPYCNSPIHSHNMGGSLAGSQGFRKSKMAEIQPPNGDEWFLEVPFRQATPPLSGVHSHGCSGKKTSSRIHDSWQAQRPFQMPQSPAAQ
jgi:hypothetical protein